MMNTKKRDKYWVVPTIFIGSFTQNKAAFRKCESNERSKPKWILIPLLEPTGVTRLEDLSGKGSSPQTSLSNCDFGSVMCDFVQMCKKNKFHFCVAIEHKTAHVSWLINEVVCWLKEWAQLHFQENPICFLPRVIDGVEWIFSSEKLNSSII